MGWPGGLVVTLPCDRGAAVAALRAAAASLRRGVLIQAGFSLAMVVGMMFFLSVFFSAVPGVAGGFLAAVVLLVMLFAAIVPVASYVQVRPWMEYLEELARGLEEGRIRVEDVCGRPLVPPWRRGG